MDSETPPNDLPEKLKWIFRRKLMSILYSFNEQYEWNVMIGIIVFLFIISNISLIIGQSPYWIQNLLVKEIAARGEQFANEVARFNAANLSRGNLDRLNTTFLDNEAEGVQSYELYDLEGRIVRPISKLNSYINDSFSIQTMRFFKGDENVHRTFVKDLGDNEILNY